MHRAVGPVQAATTRPRLVRLLLRIRAARDRPRHRWRRAGLGVGSGRIVLIEVLLEISRVARSASGPGEGPASKGCLNSVGNQCQRSADRKMKTRKRSRPLGRNSFHFLPTSYQLQVQYDQISSFRFCGRGDRSIFRPNHAFRSQRSATSGSIS